MSNHLRAMLTEMNEVELLNFLQKLKKFVRTTTLKPFNESINVVPYKKLDERTRHQFFNIKTLDGNIRRMSDNSGRVSVKKEKQYIVDALVAYCEHFGVEYDENHDSFFLRPAASEQFHYAAYYWRDESKSEIEVCYLLIKKYSNADFKIEMRLYDLKGVKDLGVSFNLESVIANFSPTNFFIYLEDKDSSFTSSHLVLVASESDFSARKFIVGTFSTVSRRGRQQNNPVAGLICLEKMESEEMVKSVYLNQLEKIQPAIYDLLYRARLIADNSNIFYSIKDLPTHKEVSDLNIKFAGHYICNIISHEKEKPFLETFLLIIKPDTTAMMKLEDTTSPISNKKPKEYKGRIRLVSDRQGLLIGYFEYLPGTKVNRFTIYINNTWRDNMMLYGVYAGIDGTENTVIAGRIRLRKIVISGSVDEYIAANVYKQPLDDTTLKSMEADLLSLLSGDQHPYDYLESIKSNHLLEYGRQNPLNQKKFPITGRFFVYSLSGREDLIVKLPVEIDEYGNVLVFSESNSNTPIGGKAYYDGSKNFTIHAYSKGNSFQFSYYMFMIEQKTDFRHAFGISCKLSRNLSRTVGKMEIIVRAKADETFDMKQFTMDSPEYYEMNLKMKGLLGWLSGKLNRVLVAPKTPNRTYPDGRVKDKEEYVNIHFYSSCYLAREGKNTESLKHLYQAYLHKFSDIKLLEKEVSDENGSLYQLYKNDVLSVQPRFNQELESLTCKAIVEKIKIAAGNLYTQEN